MLLTGSSKGFLIHMFSKRASLSISSNNQPSSILHLSWHQEDHGFTRGEIGPLVRDVRPQGAFGVVPRACP
jgi:hypothetical protein